MSENATSADYTDQERSRIRATLRTFGWRIDFEESVPSTQDVCRQRASATGDDRYCVVASAQTSGRGRQGHTWSQEPHVDVSFSLSIQPNARYASLLLPFLTGAALHRATKRWTSHALRLKWPNDLLAGDRKLAGILIEGEANGPWVVGVGLNVNRTSFPEELSAIATSLRLIEGQPLDRSQVLEWLLVELASRIRLAENGSTKTTIDDFGRGLGLLGQEVIVRTASDERRGRLVSVTPDGVRLDGKPTLELGLVLGIRDAAS